MLHVGTNGGTCEDYCTSQDAVCVKAQDNVGSSCTRDTSHEEGCDKGWGDQLCVCGKDPCEKFTNKITVCDEPEWAGEDNCAIAVKTNGGTCAKYCESQGAYCVRAQDNTNGKVCTRYTNHAEGCHEKWGDQICVCSTDPCAGYTGYSKTCDDEPEWAGEGNCMLAVSTNGGTCNSYCERQGATCVRAQDNTRNVCTRDPNHAEGCDKSWGTQICVCSRNESKVGLGFGLLDAAVNGVNAIAQGGVAIVNGALGVAAVTVDWMADTITQDCFDEADTQASCGYYLKHGQGQWTCETLKPYHDAGAMDCHSCCRY